ncbi:hypothetical protein ACAG26_10955 [Mycobacterium sp. pUA109]|uniref:WXG100-like domain-containing protein n=1 Tax=Mycobacterium sp. pUA109 TaxID=3238982 RepID=UPI00351BCF23
MAPIEVDPVPLAAAGVALAGDGEALAAALTTFSGSLKGFNAGEDTAGTVFANTYRTNADEVVKAALSALKACGQVGFGVQMSAANYAAAEAGATVGCPAPSVPVPAQPAAPQVTVTIPSPFGGGIAKPMLWAVVEFFVGDVWPNGDPGAMREAAGTWKTLGQALSRIGAQVPTVKPSITAQTIPEQQTMGAAVDDIADSLTKLAGMCSTIATELEGFAGEVEKAQNAIRDLLKRLSPSGLLDSIGHLFSGENPLEEIKAVARDIMAVLRNLGREGKARVDAIKGLASALESLADTVESWISKEFPAIAPIANALIDLDVGAWTNVIGVLGSVAALNPSRFFYDPKEALQTWKGTAEGLLMLTNPAALFTKIVTDPHGALEMGKALIDWDDLSGEHPMRGVGSDMVTLASFFLPGAEAAKPATAAAEAGARAAETATAVETRAGSALTRDAAAAARLPVADIAPQAAKITEKLDSLPQVRNTELPKPGPLDQPRPGATVTDQPRPTNTGQPAAEPKPEAVTPTAEPKSTPVEAPAGHAPAAPVEAPPGHAPSPAGEPAGPTPAPQAPAPPGDAPPAPIGTPVAEKPPASVPAPADHTPPAPAGAPAGEAPSAPRGAPIGETPPGHVEPPATPGETPPTPHQPPSGDGHGTTGDGTEPTNTGTPGNSDDAGAGPQEPAPQPHSLPDTFDPNAGSNYPSGDPYLPGRWPPDTPPETWIPGQSESGWKYYNRGTDDWVDYQLQTGGIERAADGRVPEFLQVDPATGKPVAFDSHLYRGDQEVFIDGKMGRRGLFWQPENGYWVKRAFGDLETAERQLSALPPGAKLEWHVSDPYGAAALRQMLEDNDIYDIDVIYTPKQ